MTPIPNILLTNDDGIQSPGLHAAAQALSSLGELIVVAPSTQQTAAGRSFRGKATAILESYPLEVGGKNVKAFHMEATPASVVRHAVEVLFKGGLPDLVVSGINYGENLGASISASGTLGAAIEAAILGIPALAVSRQTHPDNFFSHEVLDWTAAEHFLRFFAQRYLRRPLPEDVHLLKIDVPDNASRSTPWRLTRLSRQAYVEKHLLEPNLHSRLGDWKLTVKVDGDRLEPDSDVRAVAVDRCVSVTPLSLDATSRANFERILQALEQDPAWP